MDGIPDIASDRFEVTIFCFANCHDQPLLTDKVNRFFHFTMVPMIVCFFFCILDYNIAHDCEQDAEKLRGRSFNILNL